MLSCDTDLAPTETILSAHPPPPAMTAPDRLVSALDAARAAHRADRHSTAGAHLGDYAFRFDAGAAPVRPTVPRPSPDADWTLAETLQELRLRRVELVLASSGLKVVHGHRLPPLVRNVARHAGALTLWTLLGGHAAPDALAWDDETRLHAGWLLRLFEPTHTPVALRPGVSVTDWPRFRRSVSDRLALGPDAPHADGLRADFAGLFARHAEASVPARRPVPGLSRAA